MAKNLLTILPELDELGLKWALWFSILCSEGKEETDEEPSIEGQQLYKLLERDITGTRRYVALRDRGKFIKYMNKHWGFRPAILLPLFRALNRDGPC